MKRIPSFLSLALTLTVAFSAWADQTTNAFWKLTLPDGSAYEGEIKDGR